MYRKIFHYFILALGCLAIIPGNAHAEEWIIHAEGEFPPYNFHKEGKFTGVDTEIIERVLSDLKVKPNYNLVPWKRVVRSVDDNLTVFAFQFAPKPERFKKYNMVGPIRVGKTVFFQKKGSKINFNKLEDLKPYKIGTVLGYSYTPEYDKADFLRKEAVKDNNLNVKKLLGSRVDLIIGDLNTINHIAHKLGVSDKIEPLKRVLKEVPRYVAFPKARKAEADRFSTALDKLKKAGEIDKILSRW